MVPVESVQNDKSGSFVLLVGKDGKVQQQTISVGRQIGEDWIVTAGLHGGEQVIMQGFQKVKAGQAVNAVQQSAPTSATAAPVASTSAAAAAGQAR